LKPIRLSPTRPLRWGVLGAGNIAAEVSADIAASPTGRLQAVAARDLHRAVTFAERFSIPSCYDSYDQLVNDADVDIIYVATTHAHHHEHALLALHAGKHLLVEKPLTLTASQARNVVEAAAARDLFCMEAMWMRTHPLIRQAQHIAKSGQIGEIVGVRADLSIERAFDAAHRLYDLALGGGALLDLGIYPAHFAWTILGRPDSVTAAAQLAPSGADSAVAMQWNYRSGAYAQLTCSTSCASPYGALVTGSRGWILIHSPMQVPSAITVHTRDGDKRIKEPLRGNGYGPEIAEVERCLTQGDVQSPLVPLGDTVAVLELLDDVRTAIGVHYEAG
jgi:predicted dehydrogenase